MSQREQVIGLDNQQIAGNIAKGRMIEVKTDDGTICVLMSKAILINSNDYRHGDYTVLELQVGKNFKYEQGGAEHTLGLVASITII